MTSLTDTTTLVVELSGGVSPSLTMTSSSCSACASRSSFLLVVLTTPVEGSMAKRD